MINFSESGLSNVYLRNGYERVSSPSYGPGLKFAALEDLYAVIARYLIDIERPLSAQEFRFMRKHLGITQAELGVAMGIDAQAIARWEKEKSAIPGPADRLIRILCAKKQDHKIDPFMLMDRIARNKPVRRFCFEYSGKRWKAVERMKPSERR